MDFESRASKMWFQGEELAFDAAHFRDAGSAKVEDGAGMIGDHICSGATLDDVGVYSCAAMRIIPF